MSAKEHLVNTTSHVGAKCSVLLHIQNIALFKGRIHASSRGCPADATEGKDLDYLGSM